MTGLPSISRISRNSSQLGRYFENDIHKLLSTFTHEHRLEFSLSRFLPSECHAEEKKRQNIPVVFTAVTQHSIQGNSQTLSFEGSLIDVICSSTPFGLIYYPTDALSKFHATKKKAEAKEDSTNYRRITNGNPANNNNNYLSVFIHKSNNFTHCPSNAYVQPNDPHILLDNRTMVLHPTRGSTRLFRVKAAAPTCECQAASFLRSPRPIRSRCPPSILNSRSMIRPPNCLHHRPARRRRRLPRSRTSCPRN